MANDKLAQKLKIVVKEDYDAEISIEQAHGILDNLVGYFNTLTRIHHHDIINKFTPSISFGVNTQIISSGITYSGCIC